MLTEHSSVVFHDIHLSTSFFFISSSHRTIDCDTEMLYRIETTFIQKNECTKFHHEQSPYGK